MSCRSHRASTWIKLYFYRSAINDGRKDDPPRNSALGVVASLCLRVQSYPNQESNYPVETPILIVIIDGSSSPDVSFDCQNFVSARVSYVAEYK